jgi:CRISPR/Cas system CSM-associated protein Csm4 (group 5 of RAMP superfamily)
MWLKVFVKVSKYEIETAEERKKKKKKKIEKINEKKLRSNQNPSRFFEANLAREAASKREKECHDDDDKKKLIVRILAEVLHAR